MTHPLLAHASRGLSATAELLVKCMVMTIMKPYVKVQNRLQTRQNIETKRHDNKCFSKKHILPFGSIVELGICAERCPCYALAATIVGTAICSSNTMKIDNAYSINFLSWLPDSEITFAVSSVKLTLYNSTYDDDDE